MNDSTNSTSVRIGILGCAHTGHASSYLACLAKIPDARLAAIYDSDAQRGQSYAEQFQAKYYRNVDDMLQSEDLQAVVVTSETSAHKSLILAAAKRGLHVLCEKPIASTVEDAVKIIAACQSAGVLLQIAFVSRFYPMLQTARRLVQSGESGRVIGIVGGNRGVPPLPPTYPDWITDPALAGGGALLDHSVHVTDAMRFVLGDEVETVFANTGTFREQGLKVEDCALMSLKFQDGVIATVDPSWSLPENNPYHYDFYLRILCDNGTIDLDDTRQAVTIISDKPGERAVSAEPFGIDIDLEMVQHFVRCVQLGENRFPAATGMDGLRALEIALAGYQSAKEGQPVKLNLSME